MFSDVLLDVPNMECHSCNCVYFHGKLMLLLQHSLDYGNWSYCAGFGAFLGHNFPSGNAGYKFKTSIEGKE